MGRNIFDIPVKLLHIKGTFTLQFSLVFNTVMSKSSGLNGLTIEVAFGNVKAIIETCVVVIVCYY